MKMINSVLLLAGVFAAGVGALAGTAYRMDSNPALLYWQAFTQLPELSEEERKLYENHKTAPLDGNYEALVSRYDTAFRLVRRAAHLKQRCDWGIDLADGPEAMLPQLAKNKAIALAAQFRARYFLDRGKESEAVQDLLSAFVLGRHTASDGVLISALVQIAIENILVVCIAENFHQFSSEGLQQLLSGIDASPARGTVSQSIGIGERALVGWFERRIEEIQAAHRGDEAKIVAEIREVLAEAASEQKSYEQGDQFIQAAGGTSKGLLALVKSAESFYDEMQAIAALPYDRFEPANKAFYEKVGKSTNPFVRTFFPALQKARGKEFLCLSKQEMLRAAVAYRLRGEEGLKSVRDPFGTGPFGFRRFVFQNVDRGFELESNYSGEYPDVLIFVEKSGPLFQLVGPMAGRAAGN